MKITKFMKYLILPITVLCSNGYNAQSQSDDILESYKLLGNAQILVTNSDHKTFPNSVFKLYSRPSAGGNFDIYVREELGKPNSDNIKVSIRNKKFKVNDLFHTFLKPGIVKYNDKYYFIFYEILEDTNECLWWYYTKYPDNPNTTYKELLGVTPRLNNNDDDIERRHLLEQGEAFETERIFIWPSNIRCYVRPEQGVNETIKVHKNLSDPDSELINVHLVNGNLVSDDGLFNSENGFFKCGIVRFNDDYYFAIYNIDEDNENIYNWWYLYENEHHEEKFVFLGETPVF